MIILTIRTDNPQATIGLYNDSSKVDDYQWQGHRQLAESLHSKIQELLHKNKRDWPDIDGVVVYQGPGSFTGLRIGMSVVNSLTYSYDIPALATGGSDWIQKGIAGLLAGKGTKIVLPNYGSEALTTLPKK